MITADCDSIRDELDAFVDGELRGAELRHVAQHLENCRRCTEEIEVRQSLGGLIRESVAGAYHEPIPTGLAAGVVSRVRAESYFSWRAGLGRAVDDWHWVIVGGGALSATCVSMFLCSVLLFSATGTPDADSLNALGTSLRSSPGSLYAEVSRPGGGDDDLMLVRIDTGTGGPATVPVSLRPSSEERRLVDALGKTLQSGGPFIHWLEMTPDEREYATALLASIARARRAEPAVGSMGALTVHRLHLVTNTDVVVKGLE